MELAEAIRQAHYPDSESARDAARFRLAFDELFLIQIGVLSKRHQTEEGVQGVKIDAGGQRLEQFLASLPFGLTAARNASSMKSGAI